MPCVRRNVLGKSQLLKLFVWWNRLCTMTAFYATNICMIEYFIQVYRFKLLPWKRKNIHQGFVYMKTKYEVHWTNIALWTLKNIPITSHGNYLQFVNKQAPPIVRYRFKIFVCCCRYLKDISLQYCTKYNLFFSLYEYRPIHN